MHTIVLIYLYNPQMKCCGIRDEGWGIYRQTRWYTEQPYIHDDLGRWYANVHLAIVK